MNHCQKYKQLRKQQTSTLTRLSLLIMLSGMVILLSNCRTKSKNPLPTVSNVDLQRYAGKWYEVARLPTRFQEEGCQSTAQYTAQPDGSIKVENRESCPDGSTNGVNGIATPVPGSGNARLRVKFKGFAALAPSPKEGNYWIIKLADDYSLSLVGTPDRKYLWLLSRKPKVDEQLMTSYLEQAKSLGFDISKVIKTEH